MAIVRQEPRQGKGYVVRRMFADINAGIYIFVDADNTYEAQLAPTLVELLLHNGLGMINFARIPTTAGVYRPGHTFGNALLSGIVRMRFNWRCLSWKCPVIFRIAQKDRRARSKPFLMDF